MKKMNSLASSILTLVIITGMIDRVNSQAVDPAKVVAALEEKILSKGPHGEAPSPASSVNLTSDEFEKIRGLKAKAAIVMHYSSDWSQAQVAGLKSQFEKMGIEVIAVTDAGFNAERQVAEIQTVLAQDPQIIVSIRTDADITAAAYRKASQKGVKLEWREDKRHLGVILRTVSVWRGAHLMTGFGKELIVFWATFSSARFAAVGRRGDQMGGCGP